MHWRQTSRSSLYDKPCHEFSIFFFFQQGWKFLQGIQKRETRKAQGLTSRDCIFSPDNRSASVLQDIRIFIQSCWPVDSSVQPVVEGETSHAAAHRCPPHVYSVRLHIHTEPDEFPCHGDLFPVCFPHLPAVVKLLTVTLSTVFLPNRRLICSGWLMSRAGYLLLPKCFCSYRQAAAGCVSAKCGLTSVLWVSHGNKTSFSWYSRSILQLWESLLSSYRHCEHCLFTHSSPHGPTGLKSQVQDVRDGNGKMLSSCPPYCWTYSYMRKMNYCLSRQYWSSSNVAKSKVKLTKPG